MRHIYILFCIIIFNVNVVLVSAQIFCLTANVSQRTDYQIAGEKDPIYIFYKEKYNKQIFARPSSYQIAIFEWSLYNPALNNYNAPFKIDTVNISSIDITSGNGYRVIIKETSNIDTFRCWTVIDDFAVEIINEDNDTITNIDTIPKEKIFCGYIDVIKARLDTIGLFYYNLNTHSQVFLKKGYSYNWTSNYPGEASDPYTAFGNPLWARVSKPYWKDTKYIIEATDNFGLVRRDSTFYKSIEPHASFDDPLYIRLYDKDYYRDKPDNYYKIYDTSYTFVSAPAVYRFTNTSENADSCIWFFGDSAVAHDRVRRVLPDTAGKIEHEYLKPGNYYPKLWAFKKADNRIESCIDSFPSPENMEDFKIEVEVPFINNRPDSLTAAKAPNVFVINNDINGFWRFYDDVSITGIEVVIYSRYGKKLYYYKGDIREWMGWDGSYKGKAVSTGVYYYVVKKIEPLPAFDPELDKTYLPGEVTKGFIHVFNPE